MHNTRRNAFIVLSAVTFCSSCTAYEPQWLKEQNAVVAAKPDLAASTMLTCDQLFSRLGEAHRMCMLRGIDRLGVQLIEGSYPRAAVPVLPYAYPPLAPAYAVPIVPTPGVQR